MEYDGTASSPPTTQLGGDMEWNATSVTPSLNGTVNTTVEEALARLLGPRYRSTAESAVLITVYCLIFLTGVVGNVSTCIVIIRNSYMHSATNYYLFSLAISDVLTLILGKCMHVRIREVVSRNLRSGNNSLLYDFVWSVHSTIDWGMMWQERFGVRETKHKLTHLNKIVQE